MENLQVRCIADCLVPDVVVNVQLMCCWWLGVAAAVDDDTWGPVGFIFSVEIKDFRKSCIKNELERMNILCFPLDLCINFF